MKVTIVNQKNGNRHETSLGGFKAEQLWILGCAYESGKMTETEYSLLNDEILKLKVGSYYATAYGLVRVMDDKLLAIEALQIAASLN